jgi:serine/threonine protein kinase
MGCVGSKTGAPPGGGGAGAGAGTGATSKGNDNQQLLSEYTLGEVLGQGAFGVVYACTKKGTKDFKYAVKMVDKVETPVAEIKKEADMIKDLEHPNVVKFWAVYYEKVFVCIVMDRYQGGDLIEGMQMHWKTKGKIKPTSVIHIARQMAVSIEHLHKNLVVHRDVKGDNYLTDRKDITDPGCKILMSDFGTAERLKQATDRLKISCGTKIYWPLEFYQGNYGLKVDIWALGVIMYGLLDGRFPFKGEQDVRIKPVRLPSTAPPKCQDFVLKLLEKDEGKRLSAVEAVNHPWVHLQDGAKDASVPADSTTGGGDDEAMPDGGIKKEDGANAGQDERRKELIERLENAGKPAQAMQQLTVLWGPRFDVSDRRTGKSLRYEWWNDAKMKEFKVLDLDATVAYSDECGKVDEKTVGKMLRDHNIDTEKFGTGEAKTLSQFAQEVHHGSATLMLDATSHKKLVRVVDVVLLKISCDGKTLVESEEKFADGRTRGELNRLPGTKKEPHENTKKTAERIMKDQLGFVPTEVNFDFGDKEVFEEEEESRSYPGVMTVYRKEIVKGDLSSSDSGTKEKFAATGGNNTFSHTDSTRNTKGYRWFTGKELAQKNVKLGQPGQTELSGLVQAPIGYSEDELLSFLTEHKINVTAFGQNHAKTLKEFSTELIKGESSLMVQPNGQVVRVVDVVLLYLSKQGTKDILVETQEKFGADDIKALNRLPGTKRRPDENHFVTAQRVLKRQLKMDENCANIQKEDVKVIEELKDSSSFPGLQSLYRKRIIKAELLAPR